jgi:hypothetical protein
MKANSFNAVEIRFCYAEVVDELRATNQARHSHRSIILPKRAV